tara:strand:+ start:4251 stop:4469 length:219 start_codon:yes stop_codon:yes gene_type:complete
MEATGPQTKAVLKRYDTDGEGSLDLTEFNGLVREIKAFHKALGHVTPHFRTESAPFLELAWHPDQTHPTQIS